MTKQVQSIDENGSSQDFDRLFQEIESTRKSIRQLINSQSAFEMINVRQELLIYQMDFHGGLRKIDAEEMFNRLYFTILAGLRHGRTHNNTQFKN